MIPCFELKKAERVKLSLPAYMQLQTVAVLPIPLLISFRQILSYPNG